MSAKVVAIVGSYRRDGITEAAVEAVLAGAREQGAETEVIRLIDHPIEFCTNCRACTQAGGDERGVCAIKDGLAAILAAAAEADALVLASPVNYWNITAVSRRFLERLVGCTYWPWGGHAPAIRNKRPRKPAVLISSCAMPLGFMIPLFTGASKALGLLAQSLEARPIAKIWIGMSSEHPRPGLSARNERRARQAGVRLAMEALRSPKRPS